MTKLKPHSLWLLRLCAERMRKTNGGGYSVMLGLPSDAPGSVCMATMRGLEKRGLVEEFCSGCFRPTAEGLRYLEANN
jgi:hypothetical protein